MRRFTTTISGYDKNEVHSFINEVTKEYENMLNKLKERDIQIQSLKEQLKKYESMESTLNRAILVAEDASNQIKKIARDESKNIIEDAKKNASRIINEALIKAEKTEVEADELRRRLKIYKRRIKDVIEEQLEMVDDVDNIQF